MKNPVPNPPQPLRIPSQNPVFSIRKPPKSGHATASVPTKFPNKAQIDPRLGYANPLFDRKLLDILHEEGPEEIGY